MDFVKLYAKVAYHFTGKPQREEIYEYPFEAIREAVINSVIHKYYFEHGHNNLLRFFPDKIRIENFWVKPQHFRLGKTVFRRNPLTVDLFSRINFGEKMGTGLYRMKDICKRENTPFPKVEYNENYFYINFTQSNEYIEIAGPSVQVVEKVVEKVTENQLRILEEVRKNKYITAKQLSSLIGISSRKIQDNMKKLKENGLLKRTGSYKGGCWEVVK